jgi:hypothetical protein
MHHCAVGHHQGTTMTKLKVKNDDLRENVKEREAEEKKGKGSMTFCIMAFSMMTLSITIINIT